MVYAEILSGGSGSRFGNREIPKQYNMINDRPIITYTIESILSCNLIDKVIICCHDDWKEYLKDIVKKYFPEENRIEYSKSGIDRNESMFSGCNYIKDNYGVKDDDIILTIDAVRLLVTEKIIRDNIEAAKNHSAVGTFFPVVDTVIQSYDGGTVQEMPIRKFMYQAQAPQTFNLKKLIDYYSQITEEERKDFTDVSKIFFLNGENVYMVEGSYQNMKITYPEDIEIAKQYIKKRQNLKN